MRVFLAILSFLISAGLSFYFFLNSTVQEDLVTTNVADAWVILTDGEDGLEVSVHKGEVTDRYKVSVVVNRRVSCIPYFTLPMQSGWNKLTCLIPDLNHIATTDVEIKAEPILEPGAGTLLCERSVMSDNTGSIFACDWRRFSFFREATQPLALYRPSFAPVPLPNPALPR